MNRKGISASLAALLLFSSYLVLAQQKAPKAPSKQDAAKAQQRADEIANKALKKWLEEDVVYIISDEEKTAFKRLKTDEEREQFIEQFWLRRDPTPDTIENEYKEEHYARIEYANERFTSGKPGWKTDRGRIYILYGAPDSMDDHPSGGNYDRPFNEGGGTTNTYPFVIWNYRYIEGIGNNVQLEFVDPSLSGEYRLTMDPFEKDALAMIPGAGLTDNEQQNGGDKSKRAFLGTGAGDPTQSLGLKSQFDRLEVYSKIFKAPEVKFTDLQEVVTENLSFNLLPFQMNMNFIRVTEDSVQTPITLQFHYKDLAFQETDGVERSMLHVYGKITSVNGRTAGQFEDPIGKDVPTAGYQQLLDKNGIYQKNVPLSPGLYKLALVIKDINSGNAGTLNVGFRVPRIPDEKLGNSSLILAERIEDLPPREIATGQFILGGRKVIPNVLSEFNRNQDLNYWLQIYGLKVDEASHKPSATIETLITRNGREVKKIVEESDELSGAGQQMTITRKVSLADFEPGTYDVQVKVTDNLTKDLIAPSQKFKVK